MTASAHDKRLFWGCFVALIATAFGFIIRAMILGEWQEEFNLDETQKGKIQGVGLWPFAISIVIFSLFIDRIGYGKAMVFAFICHVTSAVLTIFATGYTMLWLGTFIVALGNGTVEAFINPVVATMFRKEKTKWLNILHAGWPAGLVVGGIITLFLGQDVSWKIKVGLLMLPTALYGIMLFGQKFPPNERVAAGISDKDMLREVGVMGGLIVSALIVLELGGNVLGLSAGINWAVIAALTVLYGLWVRSLGRILFALLLLLMIPLATTELGVDSWVTDLMTPQMGANAGWVLVYTSFIMMVLRFSAGAIVHRISPLGLLAVSSLIACGGLLALSGADSGWLILAAASLYALGKTFFWPTMLGVVSEQFPKGGALTLNITGGVGMLGVGIVGSVFLGSIQDKGIDEKLAEKNPAAHARYIDPAEKTSIFGDYQSLDQGKAGAAKIVAEAATAYAGLSAEKQAATSRKESIREAVKASIDRGAASADSFKALLGVDSLDSAAAFEGQAVDGVVQAGKAIQESTGEAKKEALSTVAIFPAFMLICYIALMLYFKSRGGYKAVHLEEAPGMGSEGQAL